MSAETVDWADRRPMTPAWRRALASWIDPRMAEDAEEGWFGSEAVGFIREAMQRATGTNCTFVDDDMKIMELLASRAIAADMVEGLPRSMMPFIRAVQAKATAP